MKEFMLGVNYWASHAGADMWRDWREDIVRRDLEILSQNGVRVLRVFPNWRDFQPVEPLFGGGHGLREYRMTGDRYPENSCFLEEKMLDRFSTFCKIAEEKGMKLIVGLITGWMSGRLFLPAALYGKNIFTDPAALYFQQLFIRGFVERMKSEKSICAWDLGNECNCMDQASVREEAYSWSAVIVNAVKACEASRPIVSGMHSLTLDGVWNIQDQGELTDILTTHPYPFWVEHCQLTPLNSFRTLLHATAQTQYYASIGQKPCLVEELGSMGPMNCSEELAAGFLKANLWSNWANGALGVLWWCACDQSLLTAPPYDWNMCERELGMLDASLQPKPSLRVMKEFSEQLKALDIELPYRETDGVCILSWGQEHWGIAYMSYILAKQAGLTLDFAYCDQPLKDSRLYFLPSAHMEVMSKRSYDELKRRVAEGATLYISVRDGIFTEFEELTGFRVETACKAAREGVVDMGTEQISYRAPHHFALKAGRATVLYRDKAGEPVFGETAYGKGKVYFLNFPVEEMLLYEENGFSGAYYRFYELAAKEVLSAKRLQKSNPFVGITRHRAGDREFAVLVNYTDKEQAVGIRLSEGTDISCLYGDGERLEPFGAAVIQVTERRK